MILFYNIWLQENEKFCIILFYIRLLYKRWNHQYQCVCSNACINCISPTTTNKTKKFLSRKMRKKYGWVYDKELKRNQQVHSKQFFYHVFFLFFQLCQHQQIAPQQQCALFNIINMPNDENRHITNEDNKDDNKTVESNHLVFFFSFFAWCWVKNEKKIWKNIYNKTVLERSFNSVLCKVKLILCSNVEENGISNFVKIGIL